jgi:HD-like signal output (HDOD) protein
MRVLIYTEDTTDSAALARLVSYAGHDPVVVPDAARARHAVVSGVVAVAVLDLERHEDETIELVRLANADGRSVATLLVSTTPEARLIIECHRLGATDFILRPLSRGEFRGIFDRMCDRLVAPATAPDANLRTPAPLSEGLGLAAQATLPGVPRIAPPEPPSMAPRAPLDEAIAAAHAPLSVPAAPVRASDAPPAVAAVRPAAPAAPVAPVAPRAPSPASAPPALVRPPEAPAAPKSGGWYEEREVWPEEASAIQDASWGSSPPTLAPASPPPRAAAPLPPTPTPAIGAAEPRGGPPAIEDINADSARSESKIRQYVLSSEGSLPVPGRVVARLARLESEEDPDFNQVVEVVESNAMMVRGIMKQAASAEQYRGQPALRTVRECVTRLGTRRVISAAMASAVRVNFEARDADFMRVFGAVWVAQYVASRVAERLCQHLRIANADAVQNRVLFMDVGEMVICRAAVEFWPHEIRGGQMSANLLRFMHDNVRSIGSFTLRQWGMPEDFSALARRDSRLAGETTRANVNRMHIALASAHAARQCLGPAAGIPAADPVSTELWSRLGITEANARKMAEEMLVSTKRLLQG